MRASLEAAHFDFEAGPVTFVVQDDPSQFLQATPLETQSAGSEAGSEHFSLGFNERSYSADDALRRMQLAMQTVEFDVGPSFGGLSIVQSSSSPSVMQQRCNEGEQLQPPSDLPQMQNWDPAQDDGVKIISRSSDYHCQIKCASYIMRIVQPLCRGRESGEGGGGGGFQIHVVQWSTSHALLGLVRC